MAKSILLIKQGRKITILGEVFQDENSAYSNVPVSNNICYVCGGDHDVLVISLENGGHIITRSFCKRKATKVKVGYGKRRAARLDLVDTFWPNEKEGY